MRQSYEQSHGTNAEINVLSSFAFSNSAHQHECSVHVYICIRQMTI